MHLGDAVCHPKPNYCPLAAAPSSLLTAWRRAGPRSCRCAAVCAAKGLKGRAKHPLTAEKISVKTFIKAPRGRTARRPIPSLISCGARAGHHSRFLRGTALSLLCCHSPAGEDRAETGGSGGCGVGAGTTSMEPRVPRSQCWAGPRCHGHGAG